MVFHVAQEATRADRGVSSWPLHPFAASRAVTLEPEDSRLVEA